MHEMKRKIKAKVEEAEEEGEKEALDLKMESTLNINEMRTLHCLFTKKKH